MDGDYTIVELKQGWREDEGRYHCLHCGFHTCKGEIYPDEGRYFDARTAIVRHVEQAHGSAFEAMLALNKKQTGLTDAQSSMMGQFFRGRSDKQIAGSAGTSPSTVRYARFSLREKARQAKVFLAMMELMERQAKQVEFAPVHEGATMVDERYVVTAKEQEQILGVCFESLEPPVLKLFPPREKRKLVVLRVIAAQFVPGREYTELEVNEILKPIYHDISTIRRYLIEYGFMERTANGMAYWRKQQPNQEGTI